MTNVIDSRVVSPVCTLLGCDGFDIRLREDRQSVTVTVTGEVDLATAPLLMRALLLAGVGDPPLVVIDAGPITFIGSHGLGAILAARQSLRSRSGTLVIRHSSARLRKTLAITHLTDLVDTEEWGGDPALRQPAAVDGPNSGSDGTSLPSADGICRHGRRGVPTDDHQAFSVRGVH